MKPVQWGILSTASIAINRVVPAMLTEPSCSVRAIASRTLERATHAANSLGIPFAYGSYQALLDDPEIECVYIPLPNDMHVEWCRKAMEAGKHVLCEKPLALRAEQVRSLISVRDRASRLIEEAFAIRNHPQWASMREVLASGEIGEIRSAQATLALCNLDPHDIRNRPDSGGGALYDLGSYAIVGCRYVFACEPTHVVAALDRDPNFGTDRLSTALLRFPKGHASFTVTSQGGPDTGGTHQHFGIVGSKGWMRCDFPFSHAVASACRLFVGHSRSIGTNPARVVEFPLTNQYALQARRFSRLIRGDPDVERFPLEDAEANLRVVEALFRSEKHGSWDAV